MHAITFVATMDGCPWGGSEELWSQAAACLLDRGVRVSAIVPGWGDSESPRVRALERKGCAVVRRLEHGPVGRLRRRLRGDRADYAARISEWMSAVPEPDLVVISQGGNSDGFPWALHCASRGTPYALITQAVNEGWPPHHAILGDLQAAYRRARVAYFVSEANASVTSRQLALHLPHARVVRNPYNVPYDASPAWPASEKGLRLACVARVDARCKGQDLIIDVLRQPKWRERPVFVSLFGTGPDEAWIRELIALHRLTNVQLCGPTADIEAVWAEHHALLLPSRLEGLPLAIVEAMLCGRPCVVTDVAGNAEVIEDGVSGFVAAAPTVTCLDHALERAWARRGELQGMGTASARRIRAIVPRDPASRFADELVSLAAAAAEPPALKASA